jgi:hypothetical protein
MDTEDWCGLVVRTRARLRFGVVVGMFTEGPYAGRLRVHGPYRFGGGTRAEWQGILVYAIPPEVVWRTRRGVLQLPVEAMAACAAWLVGALSIPGTIRHIGLTVS